MELSLDHSNRLAVQEQHVVRRPGSGWRLSHGSLLCRAAAASRSPASPHPQRRARRRSPSEHAARERAAQRLVVYRTNRDPSQDLGANDGPLPLVPKNHFVGRSLGTGARLPRLAPMVALGNGVRLECVDAAHDGVAVSGAAGAETEFECNRSAQRDPVLGDQRSEGRATWGWASRLRCWCQRDRWLRAL